MSKPPLKWKNITGHLHTVTAHKMQVARHCFAIGLYRQGITHDLSKFAPVEFVNSCRYYQQGKRSPNHGEREDKGYSEAWMHHKGRNRHHFEYWTDFKRPAHPGDDPQFRVQMPRKYVAEMVCDRIAASKTYLKDAYTDHAPLDYLEHGFGKDWMHPVTAMELERMMRILDRRGEKELFRFMRNYYLKGGPMR